MTSLYFPLILCDALVVFAETATEEARRHANPLLSLQCVSDGTYTPKDERHSASAHTHTLASPSICARTQGRSLSTDEKRRDRGRRSGRSGRLLTSKPTRTRGPAGRRRRRRRRKEKHEVDKPQREAFDIRSARPSIIQRHGAVPPPKKEIHPIFPFPSSFLLLPFP